MIESDGLRQGILPGAVFAVCSPLAGSSFLETYSLAGLLYDLAHLWKRSVCHKLFCPGD